MKRANDESPDSPFNRNRSLVLKFQTKLIKQKLNGGVSAESPSYFQLKHTEVLDKNSRIKELFKGYHTKAKEDYKLVSHPELISQHKRPFAYEDYNSHTGRVIFDYSSIKGSDFIDLVNDKRPELKKNSKFYEKYHERLNKKGFGLTRGMFTVESNLRSKFGATFTSKMPDKSPKEVPSTFRKQTSEFRMHKEKITDKGSEFRSKSSTLRKYLLIKSPNA